MNLEARVFSVMHSGTRSTEKMLKEAGVTFERTHFRGQMSRQKIYRWTGPAIVPKRDKEAVRESWRVRGMLEKEDLDFEAFWQEMEDFVDSHDNALVLRIDDPDRRDDDLKKISRALNKPLSIDWNHKEGARPDLYEGNVAQPRQ